MVALGTSYNLGQYSDPDFRYVGSAPGPTWNDRISVISDNQTAGAGLSEFHDGNGSAGEPRLLLGHQLVMPYVGDEDRDRFDRVDVC